MGSELEVLKKIWKNERETSVKLISNQTGLGLDYVRYLCNCLIKRGQIKPVRKKPNWYIITAKGKKELKLLGIIKPKVLKEDKGVKKVILPWPKELLKKRRSHPKGARLPLQRVEARSLPSGAQRSWAAKGKEIPVEEVKLRLGKMVEKIISFLRAPTFFTKPPPQKFSDGGKPPQPMHRREGKGRKRGKSPDGKAVEDPRRSREKKYGKR